MKLFVGYSKAPEQPQTSARPLCQSHTITSTGCEPATIGIAAYRSSPRCVFANTKSDVLRQVKRKAPHTAYPAFPPPPPPPTHTQKKKGNQVTSTMGGHSSDCILSSQSYELLLASLPRLSWKFHKIWFPTFWVIFMNRHKDEQFVKS